MNHIYGGETLLHATAAVGKPLVMKLLLEKGAFVERVVNQKDTKHYGMTPLHVAAIQTDMTAVRCMSVLLKSDADIEALDSAGKTPLILAAERGGPNVIEKVKLLFEYNAEKRAADPESRTALHFAAIQENASLVTLLIEMGLNVEAVDRYGNTPLHVAAIYNNEITTQTLLSSGSAQITANKGKATPIHYASAPVQYKSVAPENVPPMALDVLLKKGTDFDIDAQDIKGNTPLHFAAKGNYREIVRKLVFEAKADLSIKNSEGKTALEVATDTDNDESKTLLSGMTAGSICESAPYVENADTTFSDTVAGNLLRIGIQLLGSRNCFVKHGMT